jgi:hypothetical protein
MRQKLVPAKAPVEQVVKDIRRATRRHFSAEDKIRIVLICLNRHVLPTMSTHSPIPIPPTAEGIFP